MKREEAIALLKEIATHRVLKPNWLSLVDGKSGGYELHIKPEICDFACLEQIVEKRNLSLREANGTITIHREHKGFSDHGL